MYNVPLSLSLNIINSPCLNYLLCTCVGCRCLYINYIEVISNVYELETMMEYRLVGGSIYLVIALSLCILVTYILGGQGTIFKYWDLIYESSESVS